MDKNKVLADNGLIIGVDWLSFTIHDNLTADDVIQFMGFLPKDFREMPNGSCGYKHMKKYRDISVLYDGAENMGIHVNITGGSICLLLESFSTTLAIDTPFGKGLNLWQETVLSRFMSEVRKMGDFTRLDLAIDDFGAHYYSVEEVTEKLAKGCIVSKWRTSRNLEDKVIANNEKVGHTLYFGSRQSEIMLRIYDKKLEQNKNLSLDTDVRIDDEWVRWELELHKDRANGAADILASGVPLGNVAIGILSNYFRIIRCDDVNKSRCSVEPTWARFIDNVSKLHVTVVKMSKSLEEWCKEFKRQNGRSVALFLYANGGDLGCFGDLASFYENRLTTHDRALLGI